MNRDYTEQEQAHVDRTDDELEQNQQQVGVVSTLALIQEIPDVELSFSNQANRRVRVRRDGITYGISERSGPSTGGKLGRYVYGVGADLGDGLEFPMKLGNHYGSFEEALYALRECILYDPRQEGIPAKLRATHFSVSVPVPSSGD